MTVESLIESIADALLILGAAYENAWDDMPTSGPGRQMRITHNASVHLKRELFRLMVAYRRQVNEAAFTEVVVNMQGPSRSLLLAGVEGGR
jgi:hypothetical protein